MWRKTDNEPERSSPSPSSSTPSSPSGPPPRSRGGERAVIGPSISIQGDVTGEEDLVVQGRVEGKIDLKQHNVTIGKDGRVKADIYGRVIEVEGEVRGNLFGDEQIVVSQSGQVIGNITAPRVTLADGCRFKGSIDMEPKSRGRDTRSQGAPAASGTSSSAAPSTASAAAASGTSAGASGKTTERGTSGSMDKGSMDKGSIDKGSGDKGSVDKGSGDKKGD